MLTAGDPGAVSDIRIRITYPDDATSVPHSYTPKGTGITYDGVPNPRPTQYDVTYKYNGEEVSIPTIPNDPEGWAKASEYIKSQKGIR